MINKKNIYVIIPVYNESKVVGGVVKDICKYFKNVICVNDGSTDNTKEVLEDLSITVVNHPINLGAGAATQTGIDYALLDKHAEYFVTIDADGQHKTKDAVKMVEYIKDKDLDVVFGSRFLGDVQNISSIKKYFLKLAALFSGNTSGVKLTDPHIGLRVFNRKFAENLKITLNDFAHASEVVHRIKEGNYKYAEVPVTVTYSEYSKAKGQPMLNAINITFDLLMHRMTKKK